MQLSRIIASSNQQQKQHKNRNS